MRRTFAKDGLIRSFEVENDRVMATIKIGGEWVANPSLESFLADGWREYIVPVPEPVLPTYSELVEQYIREHGYETYGAELATINNYAENPTEYLEAWQTYMGVRHAAKEWAENQTRRDE